MLTNTDLVQIKEIINLLIQSGQRAYCATVSQELLKTGNPKFRPGNWDEHQKFLSMIDQYPNDFRIIEHNPTVKEIVLISGDNNITTNPSPQVSSRMTFEKYLDCRLDEELIAESCQIFNLTDDMRDPSIIKMYLKYLYYKAKSDGKVLEHRGAYMFHTGWFYESTDPIYCIWGRVNKETNAFNFIRRSGRDGRLFLNIFNNNVPEKITFPRMEFNPDLCIEPEFGHIFGDRISRIPVVVKKMIYAARNISFNDGSASADESILSENQNYLKRLLFGCLEETRLRIRNNTEEAVPFWNKRNAQMGWLFPLRMGVSDEVNLVAILEPTTLNGKDIYRAHTVIGLKEAYTNARLLGPVTAEWLRDAWH